MSIGFVLIGLSACTSPAVEGETPTDEVESILEDSADTGDSDLDTGVAASLCTVDDEQADCPYSTLTLNTGALSNTPRDVHWQRPGGEPPEGGWPFVLLFQGSFLPADLWSASTDDDFGLYFQVRTIALLLENGYAVITPETHFSGTTYWDTNVYPWSVYWDTAPDHYFMVDVLDAVQKGDFGRINPDLAYATGLSSGGYMTSRMAVSYPGRFRALAIQSASYATCLAEICTIPELPVDHPPTLFLHGAKDDIAPLSAMELYYDTMKSGGFDTEKVVEASTGHAWLSVAPEEVLAWVQAHP